MIVLLTLLFLAGVITYVLYRRRSLPPSIEYDVGLTVEVEGETVYRSDRLL